MQPTRRERDSLEAQQEVENHSQWLCHYSSAVCPNRGMRHERAAYRRHLRYGLIVRNCVRVCVIEAHGTYRMPTSGPHRGTRGPDRTLLEQHARRLTLNGSAEQPSETVV